MNYIWEVLLKAKEKNIVENEIVFSPGVNPRPYIEVALDELNPSDIEKYIDVNAYYRFSNIFQPLLENNILSNSFEKTLFDVIMHFLGEFDLMQGLCKKEYYGLLLKKETNNGSYGNKYLKIIDTFEIHERASVIENMVKLYTVGPSIELLRTILRQLYRASLVYLDTVDIKKLLIYIGQKQTSILCQQVEFILDVFVPIDYKIELFWEMHFGIIAVDETMLIDDLVIF